MKLFSLLLAVIVILGGCSGPPTFVSTAVVPPTETPTPTFTPIATAVPPTATSVPPSPTPTIIPVGRLIVPYGSNPASFAIVTATPLPAPMPTKIGFEDDGIAVERVVPTQTPTSVPTSTPTSTPVPTLTPIATPKPTATPSLITVIIRVSSECKFKGVAGATGLLQWNGGETLSFVTDEKGEYKLEGVVPGRVYNITITPSGGSPVLYPEIKPMPEKSSFVQFNLLRC